MALRSFASNVLPVFGFRLQPLAVEFSRTVTRTYVGAVPTDLKYASSHEWARIEDGIATVGISDHAQAELGDVVYVELPEVGKTFTKGEPCATIESVKAASDIYAPVSGEVMEVNGDLAEPDAVNADPYGDGWLLKIRMSNFSDADSLLDADAYKKQIN